MYANVRGLACIPTYAHAEQFFAEVQPHSRCKKYAPHQRSLKPQRPSGNEHYRIEKHEEGNYYDLVLYRTVMARYYKPDAQGHERRLYNGNDTQTSRQFMWQVCGKWNGNKHAAIGREDAVTVPLYPNNALADRGDAFTADLMFVGEALDLSRSQHTPHHRRVLTDDDKANRAKIKELMRPFLDLMYLRMPAFIENAEIQYSAARPFGGNNMRFSVRFGAERMLDALRAELVPNEEDVEAFFELCQECFNTIASKRGYNQKDFNVFPHWKSHRSSEVSELHKPVTEKELEKSVMYWVFKLAGANVQHGREPMPQFMNHKDYPRGGLCC